MRRNAPKFFLFFPSGKIRLLSHEYVNKLIERVLDWAHANSVPWDNIPAFEASTALLDEEPETIMRDFFWPKFSEKLDGGGVRMLPEAVARSYVVPYLRAGPASKEGSTVNNSLSFQQTFPAFL